MGPWKPRKSWNLKILMPGLESPWIFVEVLESPWIFVEVLESRWIYVEVLESHWIFVEVLLSLKICVYFRTLKVCEFIEKVLEFDIGRSWKVLEFEMSTCVWTLLWLYLLTMVNWFCVNLIEEFKIITLTKNYTLPYELVREALPYNLVAPSGELFWLIYLIILLPIMYHYMEHLAIRSRHLYLYK